MRPLVTFADARIATLDLLRERLASYAPSATAGTKTPEELGTNYPGAPYVMVALDASAPDPNGVVETVTVRVAVWGESDAAGQALAQTAHALLLAYEGGVDVRSFAERTGPVPTGDPESGSPLSSFTVAARMRPHAL